MNFSLTQIPERTKQPRQNGLTMVMDKGLSLRDAESFISVGAPHTDIVKLGFGTSFVDGGGTKVSPREEARVASLRSWAADFGGILAGRVRGNWCNWGWLGRE